MKKIISIFLTVLFLFNSVVFGADGRPQISDDSALQVQISEYCGKIFETDCNYWSIREKKQLSNLIGTLFAGVVGIAAPFVGPKLLKASMKKNTIIMVKAKKKAPKPPETSQPGLSNSEIASKRVEKQAEQSSNYKPNVRKDVDINSFNFETHLRMLKGNSSANMVNPQAYHILFKKWKGKGQKALVHEGQTLLRKYGLDPIYGKENLVWAPNSVKGQHNIIALKNVVKKLRDTDSFFGTKEAILETLKELGKTASKIGN